MRPAPPAPRWRSAVNSGLGRGCAGQSTAISATTRPGRGDITSTRSASSSASSTSCVTSTTVRGSAASAPASHSCICPRVIESSAPNGSSSSSTGRPASSVRRKATRWRMPPLSSAGDDSSNSARPKRSNSGAARRRRLGARRRPGTRARARRSTARCARAAAGRAAACRRRRQVARRPSASPATDTVPDVGSWSPAISSSSVDLPQPDGPTTATVSPPLTSSERPSSAVVAGARRRAAGKTRDTSLTLTDAAVKERGSSAGASSLDCKTLPPRALPHRFEGSAPGDGCSRVRYLSPPSREPPCSVDTGG